LPQRGNATNLEAVPSLNNAVQAKGLEINNLQ
jgi:hypothetical protein